MTDYQEETSGLEHVISWGTNMPYTRLMSAGRSAFPSATLVSSHLLDSNGKRIEKTYYRTDALPYSDREPKLGETTYNANPKINGNISEGIVIIHLGANSTEFLQNRDHEYLRFDFSREGNRVTYSAIEVNLGNLQRAKRATGADPDPLPNQGIESVVSH